MYKEPFFKDLKPFPQLVILLAMTLFFMFFFSLAGMGLTALLFDFSLQEIQMLSQNPDLPNVIGALKFVQAISQIGTFIIPPLLFAVLTQPKSIKSYFMFRNVKDHSTWLWSFAGVFTIVPLIGILMHWNMSMDLPDYLSGIEKWMKQSEETSAEVMHAFLDVNSSKGLFINLFVIAVLPALGEELLFRGGIQQVLDKLVKNKHLAIIFTAILFSAFHMQFYGFMPRFVLGLLLGYAFYLSGNIWVPIVIHFVNNAFSVIVAYLYNNEILAQNYDEIGITTKLIPILLSFLLTVYVLLRIRKNEKEQRVL
ncbi:MAG: CPBP family intramembrane metalloprotease [Bacteroidales bacterium]|nr:CPBP family intramembrane metalloprotease [Bacteroidales bacterium]MCF8328400.1 CPBP family intramembrane metalloprotease [Bacteroidales bacterium]